MGRRSLSGLPLRTRTVDDDLADSNLTRQDIAVGQYAFKRVWGFLRANGWYAKPGPALSYDHFYIKPGKTLQDGVEGEDYFYGEANLVNYARSVGLFDDSEAHADTGSVSTANVAQAAGETLGESHNHPRVSQTTPTAATASSAMASSSDRATPSPKVKAEGSAVKEEGGKSQSTGKRKLKPDVEPRQWPESHRRKGGHAADAICIDSDSDEEEKDDKAPEPKRRGNPGKRKAPPILDDSDEDDDVDSRANGHSFDVADDASVGTVESDATGYSAASTETSSTSKRPLLTTRVNKKQKVKTVTKEKKTYKPPGPMMAMKRKSGPRGLMFQRSVREILGCDSPEVTPVAARSTKPAENTAPPSPDAAAERHAREPIHSLRAPKPSVAHGLESQFNATVKEEIPAFSPPTPPPRPSSRASSVASSQRSSSQSRTSATEAPSQHDSTQLPATATILEVEGVAFPARPTERYRVLITQDSSTRETTIWMEEQASLQQRHITFTDITSFSDESVPRRAIFRALYCSLIALSENVIVRPPNVPESAISSTGSDASSIDFVRDGSSESIQLRFPDSAIWLVVHTFPMEAVPENQQVRALRDELARSNRVVEETRAQLRTIRRDLESAQGELKVTREELQTVQGDLQTTRAELVDTATKLEGAIRDRDAFKKQHEHLEKEYQKLRAAKEHTRQKHQQPGPAIQAQSRAPSPSPPRARSQPKTQSQTPPKPQQQPKAKSHSTPPPQPRVQPQSQAKSPSQSQAKAPKASQRQEEKPRAQQKSPVRAPTSTATTTRTANPVRPIPSGNENDPKVFHAEGKWLDSTFPKCQAGSPWTVQWTKLISTNAAHFSVTSENGKLTQVKMNVPGSYHLAMVVSHASTMLLSIVISAAESTVRRVSYHPRLIQCSADESVFAELRPCSETDPLSGRVEQLEKFSPPPNDWRIEWKQGNGVTNGTANGKQSNGIAH